VKSTTHASRKYGSFFHDGLSRIGVELGRVMVIAIVSDAVRLLICYALLLPSHPFLDVVSVLTL